jgi:microcin C transport system permease protein
MGNYIFRRLALMLPTLFGIMLINFVVVQAAPGGPVEQMIYRMQHAPRDYRTHPDDVRF